MPKLKIGTRGSPLALYQANETRDRLMAAHGYGPEPDPAAIEHRMAGERRAAGPVECRQKGPLAIDRHGRGLVVERPQQLANRRVILAGLDADAALRHGGQHHLGGNQRGDLLRQPQPPQAGRRSRTGAPASG